PCLRPLMILHCCSPFADSMLSFAVLIQPRQSRPTTSLLGQHSRDYWQLFSVLNAIHTTRRSLQGYLPLLLALTHHFAHERCQSSNCRPLREHTSNRTPITHSSVPTQA